MAFGAWVGCAMGLETTLLTVVFATLQAQVVLLLAHIVIGRLRGNPSNDFIGAERASADEMLPAQTTLAVGSIGGILLFFVIAASYLPHNNQQPGAAVQPALQRVNPPVGAGPPAAKRN